MVVAEKGEEEKVREMVSELVSEVVLQVWKEEDGDVKKVEEQGGSSS